MATSFVAIGHCWWMGWAWEKETFVHLAICWSAALSPCYLSKIESFKEINKISLRLILSKFVLFCQNLFYFVKICLILPKFVVFCQKLFFLSIFVFFCQYLSFFVNILSLFVKICLYLSICCQNLFLFVFICLIFVFICLFLSLFCQNLSTFG